MKRKKLHQRNRQKKLDALWLADQSKVQSSVVLEGRPSEERASWEARGYKVYDTLWECLGLTPQEGAKIDSRVRAEQAKKAWKKRTRLSYEQRRR